MRESERKREIGKRERDTERDRKEREIGKISGRRTFKKAVQRIF